jgi:hypothetical protein
VRDFVATGGTLVLLGDARAPPAARKHLNDLAAAVGSDLRVNGDAVVDPTNNVEQAAIPTTTRFDESLPLFEAYEPGRTGDDSDENDGGTDDEGSLVIEDVNANAMGPDYWNPSGEYVVFRNAGDAPLDLTGYTVTDSDGHTYQFTSGFTLAADATVTLRSGRGINTGSTLYWGSGPIWNNHGDTVRVLDETGETVASKRY